MGNSRWSHIVTITIVVSWCALLSAGVSGQWANRRLDREVKPAISQAISRVQAGSSCQGSTTTNSFPLTAFFGGATAGNLLVATASARDAAVISTPVGWTQVFQQTTVNSAPSLAMFYRIATGGETGVTISFSGQTRPCVAMAEYSGTAMNAPVHGKSIGYVGSGNVVPLGTGTIDIISSTDLGVAVFSENSSGTGWVGSYTAPPAGDRFQGSPFFLDAYGGPSGSKISMMFDDCVIGSCAGTTSTTLSDGGPHSGFIASFYPKVVSSTTGSGSNVVATSGNASVTFPTVTASGTLTATSIDPTSPSQGTPPSGITYSSTSPAYDITTTATFSGTLRVCIRVDGISAASFTNLKLLHKEGSTLVDRTSQVNPSAKLICGNVTSLSPFIVANGSTPTAASVNVSGRVLTGTGAGIRGATVELSDQRGGVQVVKTGAFGYYRFDSVVAGETYVLSVSSRTFTFLPRVVNVTDQLTDVDLVASP